MLKLENVSKHWGNFTISNVSFTCKREEYFVIMGPTGAGKTLLLQLIAGIDHPDEGRIFIDDVDVTDLPSEKREIGYVPQNYALFPHFNVYENIAYGLKAKKLGYSEIDKKVKDLTQQLNIDHLLNRYPATLSGGEQQRVAIARALIIKPKLLLLDEPLGALDLKTREELRDYLRLVNRKFKVPVVHVTHDLTEALALADRLAIMFNGRILQIDTPEKVLSHPSNPVIPKLTGVYNIFRGKATPKNGLSLVKIDNLTLWVVGKYSGEVIVTVRPESILVSNSPIFSSGRNTLEGILENIENKGLVYAVIVNILGKKFTAYITKASLEELKLKPKSRVFLTFKASEVHVIER